MHYPAAPTFGNAAPCYVSPTGVPTDSNARRNLETACQGAVADPASEPFSSGGLTFAGGESHPRPASQSSADQTQRRLLAAISTGDRAAFRQLYFLYFPQLAKFFSRVLATPDAHVIEDLIAEVMSHVWYVSGAFGREKSVDESILRIAYRCACARLPVEGQPNQLVPRPASRNLDLNRKPESPWQRLHNILAALPMAQRAVIQLVYSGHSRQEVADILDTSCESVDAHLATARVALDPWLASRLGTQ